MAAETCDTRFDTVGDLHRIASDRFAKSSHRNIRFGLAFHSDQMLGSRLLLFHIWVVNFHVPSDCFSKIST
jgi:hypothetical protein